MNKILKTSKILKSKWSVSIWASLVLSVVTYYVVSGILERREISYKIVQHIQKNCSGEDPCMISLKDALDFEWDKLYFFSYSFHHKNKVKDIIRLDYDGAQSYDEDIVCLLKGQIADSDIIDRTGFDIDPIIRPDTISFSVDSKLEYVAIDADDSSVMVQRHGLSIDGYYYELTPVAPTK
jgi:hypothetical protein